MISSLCKTTYTLRSPQQRSSPIPWSWYFPGAGLRLQSEAPWSGPLVQCQSHPWLSGEVKGEKNSMLNQDHSGGLLTPAVPSSCSLITPVVVSLVNKNRRRSLKKKKEKRKQERSAIERLWATWTLVWDSQTNTTPLTPKQTERVWPYHCLLEVALVVDVVHFVGARLIEVTVVIQACDSQAILLLRGGSFYQLLSRN